MMEKRAGLIFLIAAALLLLGGCMKPSSPLPPTAAFSVEASHGYLYAPLEVRCDASASVDPDGQITQYVWRFGDGATGSGKTPTHTYTAAGDYTITLRVDDAAGNDATATAEIHVLPVGSDQLLRRYTWTYGGEDEAMELLLPKALYETYHNQPRTPLVGDYNYDDYVNAPRDDPTLEDVANKLNDRIGGAGGLTFAKLALSFIQGAIAYVPDKPGFEYPLYPLETLVDKGGDCEDTTILYVSLLRALGIHVTMAFVDTDGDALPDHVLGLVPVPSAAGLGMNCPDGCVPGIWSIGGQLYAVAETAVDPTHDGYIPLGCDPWGIGPGAIKQRWDY